MRDHLELPRAFVVGMVFAFNTSLCTNSRGICRELAEKSSSCRED